MYSPTPINDANFYAALPPMQRLRQIVDGTFFRPVPADWWVVISDVVNSTQRIAMGRYKEVNLMGASTIVAVLNVASGYEIPFVFGGDGATVLIPNALKDRVASALLAVQSMAAQSFHLELRVGMVPVADLSEPILVGKLAISPHYNQAIFKGGGAATATELVKSSTLAQTYPPQLAPGTKPVADLTGLECRWQAIPSRYAESVSLIVIATMATAAENDGVYLDVVRAVEATYGTGEERHPVAVPKMHLSWAHRDLLGEAKVFMRRPGWRRWSYLWWLRLVNLLGWLLMRFGGKEWQNYKNLVLLTVDFQKFDDGLRMVVSGDAVMRRVLVAHLEEGYQLGRLIYGYHVSDHVLMTCLVFERHGQQVHFVDGADGGYAMAAKALKQRWEQRQSQRKNQ